MILAIDAGNTHIVLGCLEAKRTRALARISNDPTKTTHEYAILIRDVLDFECKEGAFRGGTISPGPVLSMKALAGSTAQLPEISVDVPKHCIGTDTISCMHSGAIYGAAAMLDGLIERMETELGYSATLIATGGLAACVLPHCHREIHYEPDLLLNGLKVIWDKNKK